MPQISPGNDGTFGGVGPPKLTELRSGLPAQAKNDGTFHLASKNVLKIPENLLKILEIPQDAKNLSNVLIRLPIHSPELQQ